MNLLEFHKKSIAGQALTEEEFDHLRGMKEEIEDILEVQNAIELGIHEKEFLERANGPSFAVVVGHTRNSKGASGGDPINQSEYPWNKDLANLIMTECSKRGIESKIFYRDNIGIAGAYKQVYEWGASCVVELHFNAASPAAYGTETLYDNDTNSGSRAWAQLLQDGMVALYDRKKSDKSDRGLKERDPGDRGYRSVSAIDIPSALIEPFFGSNPTDAKLGKDLKKELAATIAEAAASQLALS